MPSLSLKCVCLHSRMRRGLAQVKRAAGANARTPLNGSSLKIRFARAQFTRIRKLEFWRRPPGRLLPSYSIICRI